MTSQALTDLLAGVEEVRALRSHYPVPRRLPTGDKAVAARAHGRSCVVLLSSHLDRYIYAVNEEAIDWLNLRECALETFPKEFLLQHSRGAVDAIAERAWERRADPLREFVRQHGPIWSGGGRAGLLEHGELMSWLKSPKPESLVRFYRLYGIENIFNSVTRNASTRSAMYLDLRELVEKRNNIAHGDFQTQALPIDVTRYLGAVSKFAKSADLVFARKLATLAQSSQRPW